MSLSKGQKAIIQGYIRAYTNWPPDTKLYMAMAAFQSLRYPRLTGLALYSSTTPIDPENLPAHVRCVGYRGTVKAVDKMARQARKLMLEAGVPEDRIRIIEKQDLTL